MWSVVIVVGQLLVDVVLLGLIFVLFQHYKDVDDWLYGWIAAFVAKHNRAIKRVRELEEAVDAWKKMVGVGVVDLHGDMLAAPERVRDYSRTVAVSDSQPDAENVFTDLTRTSDAAVYFPDIATVLTYPHTLRQCCSAEWFDGCPPRSIIDELCEQIRAAD